MDILITGAFEFGIDLTGFEHGGLGVGLVGGGVGIGTTAAAAAHTGRWGAGGGGRGGGGRGCLLGRGAAATHDDIISILIDREGIRARRRGDTKNYCWVVEGWMWIGRASDVVFVLDFGHFHRHTIISSIFMLAACYGYG